MTLTECACNGWSETITFSFFFLPSFFLKLEVERDSQEEEKKEEEEDKA